MICHPCKEGEHQDCPSEDILTSAGEPTGLRPEMDVEQAQTQCACQHRTDVARG